MAGSSAQDNGPPGSGHCDRTCWRRRAAEKFRVPGTGRHDSNLWRDRWTRSWLESMALLREATAFDWELRAKPRGPGNDIEMGRCRKTKTSD